MIVVGISISTIVFAEELNLIYDANGNLITGDGYFREINGFNQLSKAYLGSDSSGPLLVEYGYHPTKNRILYKKLYNLNGSPKEQVIYWNENKVRVINETGSFDYIYVYHNGDLIAYEVNGERFWVSTDLEGSSVSVTDANGTVVDSTLYSPDGDIISGGTASRFDYEGKEYDPVLQELDFGSRKYKPERAQFLQPDMTISNVYNPQNLNRYAFENNNPYRYTDSTGHYAEDVHLDLTGYLALQAGYSSEEANLIANADQSVDEGWSHPWMPGSARKHFQYRSTARTNVDDAIDSGDLETLGASLHTFQDTFSHEGLQRNSHALQMDKPDITANRPEIADYMAQETFKYLGTAKGMTSSQISSTWKQIESTVKSFNRAQTQTEKSNILFGSAGESIIVKSKSGIIQSFWGAVGRGSGGSFCKSGCFGRFSQMVTGKKAKK